jgi:hypothetical protein
MLTAQEREQMIRKIEILPLQIAKLVEGLGDEQLSTHYMAGEWNVAQNVHHLADSHLNSFIRLKLLLTEENPTIKPYNQELWAATPDGDNLAVQDSLMLLQGLHRRWVRLLRSLNDEQWRRTGIHPESGPITPESLLRTYSAHGEAHIDQIQRTLAAGGFAPREV